MSQRLYGTLMYWFEHETGEVLWLFLEDGLNDLSGAHLLRDGDMLTVFDEQDEVLFNDYIDRELSSDDAELHSLGFCVSWIQRDWQPDDWGRLFVRYSKEGERPLNAVLVKRVLH